MYIYMPRRDLCLRLESSHQPTTLYTINIKISVVIYVIIQRFLGISTVFEILGL